MQNSEKRERMNKSQRKHKGDRNTVARNLKPVQPR